MRLFCVSLGTAHHAVVIASNGTVTDNAPHHVAVEHPCAFEVRVLGTLEAFREGRPLEVGRGRQRALFALLALNAGDVLSTDRLIDELWGGRPPPTAVKALQGHVSQLRRVIDPAHEGILETRPPGYVLRIDVDCVDARRFARLALDGRQLLADDPRGAAKRLHEALVLGGASRLPSSRTSVCRA